MFASAFRRWLRAITSYDLITTRVILAASGVMLASRLETPESVQSAQEHPSKTHQTAARVKRTRQIFSSTGRPSGTWIYLYKRLTADLTDSAREKEWEAACFFLEAHSHHFEISSEPALNKWLVSADTGTGLVCLGRGRYWARSAPKDTFSTIAHCLAPSLIPPKQARLLRGIRAKDLCDGIKSS